MKKIALFILITMIKIGFAQDSTKLLIRCDDIGMCHSVNVAFEELAKSGIQFSASFMMTCPWVDEAVKISQKYKHIAYGLHLTLNSEWENYKWGPVASKEKVPTLIDSLGYFFPSTKTFFDNKPDPKEVEKELRAQIEKAIKIGLKFTYFDTHMSAISGKNEHMRILEKLAKEYKVGITRYFGEKDLQNVYSEATEVKSDSLATRILRADSKIINLLVMHIGKNTDEMNCLKDCNKSGVTNVGKHREAELQALLSPKFRSAIQLKKIKFLTYGNIK